MWMVLLLLAYDPSPWLSLWQVLPRNLTSPS